MPQHNLANKNGKEYWNNLLSLPLQPWQVRCVRMFQVLRPLDIFAIKSPRQVGKSTMIQQILLYNAINKPKCIQIVISPVNSQNNKFFKELVELLGNAPFVANVSLSTMEILFNNGALIKFKSAEQGENLRGEHCNYLFVDEAAYVSDDVFNIIRPYLNTTKGNLILTSTPRLKSGFFWECFRNADYHKRHYRHLDVCKYDNSYFINEEQIEEYRDSMPDKAFKTEIMGQFLEMNEGVFGDFTKCYKDEVDDLEPLYVGIDWATSSGEDSTVLTAMNRYSEVCHIKEWKGTDANELIDEISDYINSNPTIKTVVIEQNSIGQVYYDLLKGKVKNKGIIKEFNTNNKTKREMIESLQVGFAKELLFIPRNAKLENQLSNFIVKLTRSGKEITYENINSNVHDDYVISLALCYYGRRKGNAQYSVSTI